MGEERIWTVGEVLQWTQRFFTDKGVANPRLDAEVLLAHVLQTDRLHLYVDFHKPLQAAELTIYRELIKRRAQRIPVAYLTGKKEFMGHAFFVNPGVLIPRPDTEILVEAVSERLTGRPNACIVDVGTGSGAIIISLLKMFPAAYGIAIDISSTALAVARENACRQEVTERVLFVQGDLLQPIQTRQVDIIIANPPYIPSQDIASLAPEVQKEPLLALDGGNDGLRYYRKLISQSIRILVPGGLLAFEVGINQALPVAELIRQTKLFGAVEIIKDYAGIERVVIGQREGVRG